MTKPVATGPWNSATAYVANNISTFAGEDWVALMSVDAFQASPDMNARQWSPFGWNTTNALPGDWNYNETYSSGQKVNGYVGLNQPPWQATSLTTQNPNWIPTGPVPVPVVWSDSITWHHGSLAIGSDDNVYNWPNNDYSGPDSDPVNGAAHAVWTGPICTSAQWKGAWNAGTTYHAGDTVYLLIEETYDLGASGNASVNSYVAQSTSTNSQPTFYQSSGAWLAQSGIMLPILESAWEPVTVAAWDSSVHYPKGSYVNAFDLFQVPAAPPAYNTITSDLAYAPGAFVEYTGNIYCSLIPNRAVTGPFTDDGRWLLCSTVAAWKGQWSSTARYASGDVVAVPIAPNLDDITPPVGAIWQAVTPVTGTAPADGAWTQVGSDIEAAPIQVWRTVLPVNDGAPPSSFNDWWSTPTLLYYGY
jgi:hypothetical protein